MSDLNQLRKFIEETSELYVTVPEVQDEFTTIRLEGIGQGDKPYGITLRVDAVVQRESREFVELDEGQEVTNLAQLQFERQGPLNSGEYRIYAVLHDSVEGLKVTKTVAAE